MPCTKLCLSPVKGKIKFRDFRREILVIDHERLRDRGTHHDTLVSGHGAVYERIHGTLQLKPVPQRAAELERSKILGTDPPGQRPIGGGASAANQLQVSVQHLGEDHVLRVLEAAEVHSRDLVSGMFGLTGIIRA